MTARPDFCGVWWDSHGYTHSCLKRQGHDGAHWCCDDGDDGDGGYPGGQDWTGPIFTDVAELHAARERRRTTAVPEAGTP